VLDVDRVSRVRISRVPVAFEVEGVRHEIVLLILPNPSVPLLLGMDYHMEAGVVVDCSDPNNRTVGVREGVLQDAGRPDCMFDVQRPGAPTAYEYTALYVPNNDGVVHGEGTCRIERDPLPAAGVELIDIDLQAPGGAAWGGRFMHGEDLLRTLKFAPSRNSVYDAAMEGGFRMAFQTWTELHLRSIYNPLDKRPIKAWTALNLDAGDSPSLPAIRVTRNLQQVMEERLQRARAEVQGFWRQRELEDTPPLENEFLPASARRFLSGRPHARQQQRRGRRGSRKQLMGRADMPEQADKELQTRGVPQSVPVSELGADGIFGDTGECAICCHEYEDEGWRRVVRLECKHVACLKCMYAWVFARSDAAEPRCHCCRANMKGQPDPHPDS